MSLFSNLALAQVMCSDLFQKAAQSNQKSQQEILNEYFDEQMKLIRSHPVIKGNNHPKQIVKQDINVLGYLYNELIKDFPDLQRLNQLKPKVLKDGITVARFKAVMDYTIYQVQTQFKKPDLKPNQLWAFHDSIQILKEFVPHIYDQKQRKQQREEQARQEQKEQQEKEKQKQEQKDKEDKKDDNDKNQKDQDQQEQEKKKKEKKNLEEKEQNELNIHNKEVPKSDPNGDNDGVDIGALYTVDIRKGLLRTMIFDDVQQLPGQNLSIRNVLQSILKVFSNYEKSPHRVILDNTNKKSRMIIPTSYDYVPQVGIYDGYMVRESRLGQYYVEALPGKSLPEQVVVPMIATPLSTLSPAEMKVYTEKSKIKKEEWPDHVHMGLQIALQKASAQDQVQILSQWFQTDGPYLYYANNKETAAEFNTVKTNLEQKTGTKPYELLIAEEKMFNCDGAALIGARLVRDYLNLPARIVGGRTYSGKYMENAEKEKLRILDLNDVGHAWIEVFINGKWEPFDFTPLKNPPKDENKKPSKQDPRIKQEENDKQDDNKQEQNQQQEKEQQQDEGKENKRRERQFGDNVDQQKAKQLQDQKKQDDEVDKDDKDGQDGQPKDQQNQKEEKNDSKDKENKDAESKNGNPKDGEPQVKKEETKKQDHGIDKLPENLNNPIGAVFKTALEEAYQYLAHKGIAVDARKLLDFLTSPFSEFGDYLTSTNHQMIKMSDPLVRDNNKAIVNILNEAKTLIHREPNKAYEKLKVVEHFFVEKAKNQLLTPQEQNSLNLSREVMREMRGYSHKNAHQHELVKRMLDNLPGNILREYILKKFPEALTLGSPDQATLFDQITKGLWKGAFQTSMVNKYMNYFLAAESELRMRRVQTPLRSYMRERRSEGFVLAEMKDIASFERWLQQYEPGPDLTTTLLSKLLKDEQYMIANRQMQNAPGRTATIERKHTNIFFDISGSMEGAKAALQASAITAMIDRFLSEKDAFGQPIHTIMLFPFGDKVGQGIYISSREQAEAEILNFLNTPTESSQQTAFQPCFDKHFEVIRMLAKSNEFKLKLKKSNMILITDGESRIDINKVLGDLKSLPKELTTIFNATILGSKADSAMKSHYAKLRTQTSNSLLTEITPDLISKFDAESSKPPVDPEAFAYDKALGHISDSTIRKLQTVSIPSSESMNMIAQIKNVRDKLDSEDYHKLKNVGLVRQIDQLNNIFSQGQVDPQLQLKVVYIIMMNYQKWGGNDFTTLTHSENKYLRDLFDSVINQ